jgi:hypothetical protein
MRTFKDAAEKAFNGEVDRSDDEQQVDVRLADASPTDGVQDTAATTGGCAGVQQAQQVDDSSTC